MPRLDSGDDSSGNLLLWIIAGVVVCGLGYGAYHYMQPSTPAQTPEDIKKAAILQSRFNDRVDKRLEEANAEEQKFRESLGLTTTQTAALAALDSVATSPEGRRDLMRSILTEEQRRQWRRREWGGGPDGERRWGGPDRDGGDRGRDRGGRDRGPRDRGGPDRGGPPMGPPMGAPPGGVGRP